MGNIFATDEKKLANEMPKAKSTKRGFLMYYLVAEALSRDSRQVACPLTASTLHHSFSFAYKQCISPSWSRTSDFGKSRNMCGRQLCMLADLQLRLAPRSRSRSQSV